MEILVAIGHFAGAAATLMVLAVALEMLGLWEQRRYGEQLNLEMLVKLQIPHDEANLPERLREMARVLEDRFSDELLRNRLADFCGVVLKLWQWFGLAVLVVLFFGIAWITISANLQAAVWAWIVVGAWLFFSLIGMAFSFACKLMTGRYPGQPKKTRAALRKSALEIDQWTSP